MTVSALVAVIMFSQRRMMKVKDSVVLKTPATLTVVDRGYVLMVFFVIQVGDGPGTVVMCSLQLRGLVSVAPIY